MVRTLYSRLMAFNQFLSTVLHCSIWLFKKDFIWPFTGNASYFYDAIRRLNGNDLIDHD